MKTLDEHNAEMLRMAMEEAHRVHRNGIECPKCKHELEDSDPRSLLLSNPPKKSVHCPKCNFKGYRIA